jgi:hypothetical protein
MGREPGDDGGGDQAIWRDLVTRLEQPAADEHAAASWPDSENLDRASPGPADPANAPANRGRVIRPASFSRSAEPPGAPAGPRSEDAGDGQASGHLDHDPPPAGGPHDDCEPDADHAESDPAESTRFADPEPWRPSARNLSAEDYLNVADLGYIDYDTGDSGDRYIPPPLPPQPKLDPVAKGAWTALLGGPGYLLLAMLLGWQTPGWVQLVAIIAFIAGFLVLVIRLGDGPSRRDGPDQGAVV